MKTFLPLGALASLMCILVPATAARAGDRRSLTPNGQALPLVATDSSSRSTATSICDGDFEQGPGGSSCWIVSGNDSCEWVLNPTSIWGIAAHSGFYAYWGGGYCASKPNSSSLHQVVTVPAGTTSLDLYTVLYRPSADDSDADTIVVQLGFKIVGTIAMTQANDTYPSWVLQSFPVPPMAAGRTVSLKIKGHSLGALTGNALVDDVAFGP